MKYKVISFDLDGTLVDSRPFEDLLWFEELPKIYAEHYKVSLKEAKKFVFSEYDKISDENVNWYRPRFWFKHFKLEADWEKAVYDMRHKITLFPEVLDVLKELSKQYTLIILTQSCRDQLKLKTNIEGLEEFFSQIISSIDDLNMHKGDEKTYKALLQKLNISASEIIHIGDSFKHDYLPPQKIGIKTLYLDRKKEKKGEEIIHSLKEIKKYL